MILNQVKFCSGILLMSHECKKSTGDSRKKKKNTGIYVLITRPSGPSFVICLLIVKFFPFVEKGIVTWLSLKQRPAKQKSPTTSGLVKKNNQQILPV